MRLSLSREPSTGRRLKTFFFAPTSDRTPPVSNALESVAGKERHGRAYTRFHRLSLLARDSGRSGIHGWDKSLVE